MLIAVVNLGGQQYLILSGHFIYTLQKRTTTVDLQGRIPAIYQF